VQPFRVGLACRAETRQERPRAPGHQAAALHFQTGARAETAQAEDRPGQQARPGRFPAVAAHDQQAAAHAGAGFHPDLPVHDQRPAGHALRLAGQGGAAPVPGRAAGAQPAAAHGGSQAVAGVPAHFQLAARHLGAGERTGVAVDHQAPGLHSESGIRGLGGGAAEDQLVRSLGGAADLEMLPDFFRPAGDGHGQLFDLPDRQAEHFAGEQPPQVEGRAAWGDEFERDLHSG
jgi:hypothetical protein